MPKQPSETLLAVNEAFGPTFQGEGPSMGRLAVFLRLAMCNLKCTWCDTKYTWDWEHHSKVEETHLRTLQAVKDDISDHSFGASLLVITGGEPLLQKRALAELLINGVTWDVEIETNGTIAPLGVGFEEIKYNVSPKLANSGNSISKRYNYDVLEEFAALDERARFKFVCKSLEDLSEVKALVASVGIQHDQVWIMPEGTDAYQLAYTGSLLAEEVLSNRWNLTTRLHVQLWSNTRGK